MTTDITTTLNGLSSSARSLLDESFRSGELPQLDVSEFVVDPRMNRSVDLNGVCNVIQEVMERMATKPDQSDAWLAPRLHASLRLTRREAGNRELWSWLNVSTAPDYVRWRWPTPVPVDRFIGKDSKNSLGRLWWAAELTRNGTDYTETESVLRHSGFIERWLDLNAMHHRPAAIAVSRFHRSFNNGVGVTKQQSVELARLFNIRIATLSLDELAPCPPIDAYAVQEWCEMPVDETKYYESLPLGPDEDQVPEESINAIETLLDDLAEYTGLKNFKPVTKKSTDDIEQSADTTLEAVLGS